VVITIIVGLVIGKILATEKKSSILVSSGTAICGGTAIACLSPTIRARPEQTAVVMALVFLLNAVALFVFPIVGEYFAMTQTQFGTWAALAIHDTSSVMATASIYGEEATAVATTLKLCRTLWLIPLVLLFSLLEKSPEAKLRLPVFILLFMLASVAGSTLSLSSTIPHYAGAASKILLVIALFCIGLEINRTTLKNFRGKVLVQGLLLWAIVVPVTLLISLNIA
jgi:uncharacterized integral membrane protein (TIGR00698 family)